MSKAPVELKVDVVTTEPTPLTPGCTCGVGEGYDDIVHRAICCAPRAVVGTLACSSNAANVAGVLTNAEENLVRAVTYLLRARLGDQGGPGKDIDLGELGRNMIRDAAAEICGEEAGQ